MLYFLGILWPLEAMPDALRYISYTLPQTCACEAMRAILLRGWGLDHPMVARYCMTTGPPSSHVSSTVARSHQGFQLYMGDWEGNVYIFSKFTFKKNWFLVKTSSATWQQWAAHGLHALFSFAELKNQFGSLWGLKKLTWEGSLISDLLLVRVLWSKRKICAY